MVTITVRVGQFEACGSSQKQATERVIRKAEAALGGSYTPFICAKGAYVALVSRDPVGGWGHCLIADESGIRAGSRSPSSGGFSDLDPDDARDEAIRCAWRHVCQLAWRVEDGIDAPPEIKDKADRADFTRWARWQTRMRALLSSGIQDDEARLIESGRSPWPSAVVEPCSRY